MSRRPQPQLSAHSDSPFLAHVRQALGPDLPDLVIEREMGGGGMSRLFAGRRGAARVVVKVLVRAAASPIAERRFRREAELGQRLRHPHLLPVLAAGETDALLYLVMPFVDGGTLRRRTLHDGPSCVAETVRLLRPLADALAHLHAAGVVHGDVKPENVLLHAGRPVLADFGAARPIAPDGEVGAAVVGTPLYMAPEQASGASAADPRSDLYSLAVLGWELLVGRPPFAAASPRDVLHAHRVMPVPALLGRRADVPPALALVLERSLAKDPADRPASALAFRDALDRAAHTIRLRPAAPHRVPVARRVVTTIGRRAIAAGILVPMLASLAAAAVSAATFGGALGTVHRATAGASREPMAVVADVRVADAPAVRPVVTASRIARVPHAPRAARVLPTVRTTTDAASHGETALPSVFDAFRAPALLPLHAPRTGAAASATRVVAGRRALSGPAPFVRDRCGNA